MVGLKTSVLSDDGTRETITTTFYGTTPEAALETLEYPKGVRCKHSGDCCGHWYARAATVKQDGDKTIVTQEWYQNI
jgi:hypothetical protein